MCIAYADILSKFPKANMISWLVTENRLLSFLKHSLSGGVRLLGFGVPLMIVLFVPCVQLCDEMLFNFDPPMCLNCEVYSLGLAIPSVKRKMFRFSLGFPLRVICTLGTHACTSAFNFHARAE